MMMTFNQLKRNIEITHLKNGQYKTALKTAPHLYLVVTRVNFLTTSVWCSYMNELIANHPLLKQQKSFELLKINWMTMNKSYRRDFEKRIKQQIKN